MAKTMSTSGGRRAGGRAIRVVIPEEFEAKVEAEARRRGLALSAAVRTLLIERVTEIDDFDKMSRAEEWQRAEAWSTWKKIDAGKIKEASKAEIDAEFENSLARMHSARR